MKQNLPLFSFSIIVLILAAIFFSNINCFDRNSKEESNHYELKEYAALNDTVKYVGIKVCAQCHAEIYESFMQTGMGQSFNVATSEKSSADFSKPGFFDRFSNFNYHAFLKNDSLYIKEFRLAGSDTLHNLVRKVSYIIGSGQHTNSHMINNNGFIYQAPMTYYTQSGRWDLPPGFENGFNSRFSRAIGLECMTCHNAYPDFELGSENKFNVVPKGIDCERCHGPGQVHVNKIQSGIITDTSTSIDYSIVNPAKLPIDKQFDICMRCHVQGNIVLKNGKSFFDFKPGMKLSDVMDIYMPVFEGRMDEHIMASHAERLKQSTCFIESGKNTGNTGITLKPYKNGLTCVTCHNPHVSVKKTGTAVFNKACNNCHSKKHATLCTENQDVLARNANNCVKCHMPKNGSVDIPHVRVTDHFIRKPVNEKKLNEIRTFVAIKCINNPNADFQSRGKAFIGYFEKFKMGAHMLDSALSCFARDNANEKRNIENLIHIYFLKEDWKKVVEIESQNPELPDRLNKKDYNNEHALTAYRIAQSFENTGNFKKATIYYQRAVMLAPFHLDILNNYAGLLAKDGKLNEAMKVYGSILNYNPEYTSAWSNLGYLHLQLKDDATTAGNYYSKALTLNPDYEQAILNMAGLMVYNGDIQQAKSYLLNYLKVQPMSEKAKIILEQLNRYNN